MNTLVKTYSLTKKYNNETVVDGINLSINKGEIYGLLGPNGAGKTTTVLMLTTYLLPDNGYFEINGICSKDKRELTKMKKEIGYVPQEIALYEDLNAVENLTFFGRMYHIEKSILQTNIDNILEQVGLSDKRKQPVKHFSGGMKRRLNIAAALLHNPSFVILDEPTVGIDPQSRNRIFDIVRALKENGTSVLYITHYMEEAQQLCDRVAIMDNGHIIATDTVSNLINLAGNHHIIRVEVENLQESIDHIKAQYQASEAEYINGVLSLQVADVKKVYQSLINDFFNMGYAVKRIEIDEPDLQQVFLKLTGKSLRD